MLERPWSETAPVPKNPSSVSFVIPALNEEELIESVVADVSRTVDALLSEYEIILIDDGSTDRTRAIMDELAASLPHVRVAHNEKNEGLGRSYRNGVAAAKCRYVMMVCGDGGLPASSLPPIIEKIGTADIVIPFMRNLRQIKSPARFLISRTYTTTINTLFGQNIRYYNGLPVHRRDLLERVDIKSSGFGFQAEILIKLLKSGFSYVEVEVDGAEKAERSVALRPRNFVSVIRTLFRLFWVTVTAKRISTDTASTTLARPRSR